jgi:uncharacterized protein
MRIGILSDTHGWVDEVILSHLEGCEEIWHAGDIGPGVSEKLSQVSRFRAVYGNVDDSRIRSTYPEFLSFEINGVRVLIIHIAGTPPDFNPNTRKLIQRENPNLLIYGHSHILRIGRSPDRKLVHLNPGAAGRHGFHKMRTLVRLEISNGTIGNAEVIELGERGSIVG